MKITSLYFSFMFCTILVFSPSAIGENDLSNEHGDLVLNEPDVDMLNDSTAAATTTTSTQPVADTNNLRAYGTEFSGLTRKQRGSSHNRRLPGKGKGDPAAIKLPGLSMKSLKCATPCTPPAVCQLSATGPTCAPCVGCVIGTTCIPAAVAPVSQCPTRCLNGATCTTSSETCVTGATCCPSEQFKCGCLYPFGGDTCACSLCPTGLNNPCLGGGKGGSSKSGGGAPKTLCAIDAEGEQSCLCPECRTGSDCTGPPPTPCAGNPCAGSSRPNCVPVTVKVGASATCPTDKFTCAA